MVKVFSGLWNIALCSTDVGFVDAQVNHPSDLPRNSKVNIYSGEMENIWHIPYYDSIPFISD